MDFGLNLKTLQHDTCFLLFVACLRFSCCSRCSAGSLLMLPMPPMLLLPHRWMLENDITDVLDLTFTAESDFFGRKELVELVPGEGGGGEGKGAGAR